MANECVEAYYKVFSYPEIKDGKTKIETATFESCGRNFLFYIPIIGSIFAACLLSTTAKAEKRLSAEDKAFVARCIIALTSIGILLIFADIIGSILRLCAKKGPTPGLEGRLKAV